MDVYCTLYTFFTMTITITIIMIMPAIYYTEYNLLSPHAYFPLIILVGFVFVSTLSSVLLLLLFVLLNSAGRALEVALKCLFKLYLVSRFTASTDFGVLVVAFAEVFAVFAVVVIFSALVLVLVFGWVSTLLFLKWSSELSPNSITPSFRLLLVLLLLELLFSLLCKYKHLSPIVHFPCKLYLHMIFLCVAAISTPSSPSPLLPFLLTGAATRLITSSLLLPVDSVATIILLGLFVVGAMMVHVSKCKK